MDFQSIVKLALALLGKREELTGIVNDAIALFKKIEAVLPELTSLLEGSTKGTTTPAYSVQWLQQSLNKLINAGLTVDGKYGAGTQAAVKKFQEANGLTADGWSGIQTTAAIINALGPA